MKFEKLAQIAADHKKADIESAQHILDMMQAFPCRNSCEHASELMAAAYWRKSAMQWYFREKRAIRQMQKAGRA